MNICNQDLLTFFKHAPCSLSGIQRPAVSVAFSALSGCALDALSGSCALK